MARDLNERLVFAIRDAVDHLANRVAEVKAERDELRARLDMPCGSCHPCENYRDETWHAAGRKPPHASEWDEVRAERDRYKAAWQSARRWRTWLRNDVTALESDGILSVHIAKQLWEMRGERDRYRAQVEAVRALHVPEEDDGPGICMECCFRWPCSTLAALDTTQPTGDIE